MTRTLQTRKKFSSKNLLFLFLFAILGIMELPTSMIISVGMLPTIIAYLFEQDPSETAIYTIGPMNLVGTVPLLITLWDGRNTYQYASNLLQEPMNWLIMYGSAGFGWLLYFMVPHIVAIFVIKKTEFQAYRLVKARDKLSKKWNIQLPKDKEENTENEEDKE